MGPRQQPLWLKEQARKALGERGRCLCHPLRWMTLNISGATSLDVINTSQLWSTALQWRLERLPLPPPLDRERTVLSRLLTLALIAAHLYNVGTNLQVQTVMTLEVNSLSRCTISNDGGY